MKTHRKGMNLENNKIMKENMYLISQINKLRKDLKYIDNEKMELETQGEGVLNESPTNINDEINNVDNDIMQLKEEINEIKGLKKDLEDKLK